MKASYLPQLSVYMPLYFRDEDLLLKHVRLYKACCGNCRNHGLLLSFSFFFSNCNISLFNLASSDDKKVTLKGLNNSSDDFVLLEEK